MQTNGLAPPIVELHYMTKATHDLHPYTPLTVFNLKINLSLL